MTWGGAAPVAQCSTAQGGKAAGKRAGSWSDAYHSAVSHGAWAVSQDQGLSTLVVDARA
jgi:hypothetical protein